MTGSPSVPVAVGLNGASDQYAINRASTDPESHLPSHGIGVQACLSLSVVINGGVTVRQEPARDYVSHHINYKLIMKEEDSRALNS